MSIGSMTCGLLVSFGSMTFESMKSPGSMIDESDGNEQKNDFPKKDFQSIFLTRLNLFR